MKNKKFKLTFLGVALCFALVGCSNDDSVDGTNNNSESGVVSNDEITLTYGTSLLNHHVNIVNRSLNLNGASARSTSNVENYSDFISGLNLGAETILALNHSTNIDIAGVYRIPSGNFTGSFNVNNANVTLIIDGKIMSSSNIILNGTRVIVTGNGEIDSQANLTFNNGSSLYNWGVVNLKASTINGTIRNNNIIKFNEVITFNSGAVVTNNCQILFKKKAHFNEALINKSFVKFQDGFSSNSTGTLTLHPGSYTKVTGGIISYDGNINGVAPSSPSNVSLARLDILSPTTLGNINGIDRITGTIDINSNFNKTQLKASNSVSFNLNTYVEGSGCTESAGVAPTGSCSITDLRNNAKHFAEIASPEINGKKLSATDVKVVGNKAYVSYHTNDEAIGTFPYGSIRVFELIEGTDKGNLSLLTQADFTNCEFNALEIDNDNIYAVGSNLSGSRMFTAPLDANKLFDRNLNAVWSYKFASAGGKSIALDGTNLWVAAGRTGGGLFKFTPNQLSYNSSTLITKDGAKYVVKDGDKQIFFAIDESNHPYIRISDLQGSMIDEKTDTSIIVQTRDGKNAISVDDNYIYVALSEKGVVRYNKTDLSQTKTFVPSEYKPYGPKLFKNNGLTNAVTVDNCFVYLANGADGVIVLNKDLTYVTHFNTNLNKSVNYVYASGNYLFVATGRDGLDVIKIK